LAAAGVPIIQPAPRAPYYFPVKSLRAAKVFKVANGKKNLGFCGYARMYKLTLVVFIRAYPQCKQFIFARRAKNFVRPVP